MNTDFCPTILHATDEPPRPHQHMDGESLTPLLTGAGMLSHEALYWHYPHYNQHPQSFPSGVVRSGNWKLIENYDTGDRELYDLDSNLGERANLAATHPDTVSSLSKQLATWPHSAGADPMHPNSQLRGPRTKQR
jgi:arylsulfatase A-like enzyme